MHPSRHRRPGTTHPSTHSRSDGPGPRRRVVFAGATVLLAWGATFGVSPGLGATHPDRSPALAMDTVTDLRRIFDPGKLLDDLDGDSLPDHIRARLLLGPDPDPAETAAAANLAGRLGFETTATDLGLLRSADDESPATGPVVVVGRGGFTAAGVDADRAGVGLAPGQGAIVHLEPSAGLPFGGVGLVGYDATGLLAAAAYLSARYPAVWGVEGSTWSAVAEAVDRFSIHRAPGAGAALLDRIVIDARREGVPRARATLRVTDPTERAELLAALAGETEAGGGVPSDSTPTRRTADSAAATVSEATGSETAASEAAGSTRADSVAAGRDALHIRDLHRLDVRVTGGRVDTTVSVRPPEPWATRADPAHQAAPDAPFSLGDLYSVGGLYRDTNRDLVPDESRATLSLAGRGVAPGVVDLATRIGLETAGIRLPLAHVDGQDDDPSTEGFPILVGPNHFAGGAFDPLAEFPAFSGMPGRGFALLVDDAFGPEDPGERRGGMIVDGTDGAGVGAALDWLARRAPYLWTHGKGETRLADLETEIRRFLQVREAPGQAALALAKLGRWMDRAVASGETPERVEVEVVARDAPEGLERVAEAVVRERLPGADVEVGRWSSGFGVGDTVFVQEWEIPWEVDDVRRRLAAEVYPRVAEGTAAVVEVRVSEPPEVRTALADEIRAALADAGAQEIDVVVLSAYKQGYSWLEDAVLPRLRGLGAASIEIGYHTLEESDEIRWQTIAADTRWLQELYPIDAVLARELSIPDSAVTFRATRTAEPIYTVTARDGAGEVVLRETFSPRYVVRPFFDLFPEYEQVRVTTGWVQATLGGGTVIDERIVTDPERFWDRLQTETYGALVEYVLDTQDGAPSPANAPFFDEFRVDLRLSEPNHRIGVDEEVVSSLEALHEDIYFETLTLFDLIGSRYQTNQPYPGRVLPWIDPSGAGRPGRARLTLTGKERAGAELIVRTFAGADDSDPSLQRYPLGPLPVDAPRIVGVEVAAGRDGVETLVARVEVPDSADRYDEFRGRSSEASIDRQFPNAELLDDMGAALRRLHEAGLFTEALSWDRVGSLVIEVEVADAPDAGLRVVVPRSGAPASTHRPHLRAEGWRPDGTRLVQWDTPIPPAENDSILARLATFPQADVYFMTRSFLGQPIWAVDLLPAPASAYRSQAKLNALKPTLFISGRQHANEVSSTSHILRLAELLVTDPSYTALLDDVNVVLHPITNPDGARLAVEMQEVNPDFMLHAGYLGALGVDATSGERDDDPVYPESQVRRRLRETWLPDIYINMHGYPSHEWVQYFAGYSAWVRSRQGGQRSWWAPRGWFIPGLSIVEDDEEPEYGEAQWAVLDSIAAAITGDDAVDAMNRRLYARYRKYGVQDRDDFTEFFHEGILVNLRLRGPDSIGTGLYSPRITWFSTTTEAPDETARGEWLQLVATAGLSHATALLRYLAGGTFTVEREVEADAGGVSRAVYRIKPVLPGG